ncbi:monocarboxylate transporter 11-like [Saccostrea echinata]|uniref:monocarboxylate transporter 11-like n=1 Tax=Saccostrea echinata TaxID=191078 RepID=UPI002A7EF158|nr:monocarboxylate transporter 11-like [Saccostrea echinata]
MTDDDSGTWAPDGGYGWVVVGGSFLAHLVIGGFMRSGGVIFLELREKFNESAADTAWVISLAVTVRMLFGPLASALCNRFSCRTVVIIGGVLLCVGVLISGFTPNLAFLFFSYSLVGGIGRAFIYTPAVIIVALYFERRRGTAAGIANAGIGSGTFLVPPIVEILFQNFGFTGAFILLAAFGLQSCVSGALFRPLALQNRITKRKPYETEIEIKEPTLCEVKSTQGNNGFSYNGVKSPLFPTVRADENEVTRSLPNLLQTNKKFLSTLSASLILHGASSEVINLTGSVQLYNGSRKSLNSKTVDSENEIKQSSVSASPVLLNLSLLRNIKFLSFCIGICLYTLSFQAFYVFLPPLAIQNGQSDIEAVYVVSIAGALETIGSISSGIILDLPMIKPHRLLIYNIVLFILGILTFITPFLGVFEWLSFTCGIYGFLLGSGLAQKATLVVDILGVEHVVSSLGLLVCFQGFGVLFGPPLSGLLKDFYGLYGPGFYCSGAAMIASGIVQGLGGIIHHVYQREK